MYVNVLDNHAPMKVRKFKNASGKSKFITSEIRKVMWIRNAMKRKYYKTRSENDWECIQDSKESRCWHAS